MIEIEIVRRDPAVAPVGVVKREQECADDRRFHQVPLQLEAMRRAVSLAGDLGGAFFLVGADAERQEQECAEGEEQEIDGDDRGEGHQATWSSMTSTSGFLPDQSVAQRRPAKRTAWRL